MKKILTISDECGRCYVENAHEAWMRRDFLLVERTIEFALLENNLDTYYMVALTLNQTSSPKFRRYVKLLRALADTPIILFPYEAAAVKDAEDVLQEDATHMIAHPVDMNGAIHNSIEIINPYVAANEKNGQTLTLYRDYKIILDTGACRVRVGDRDLQLRHIELYSMRLLVEHRGVYLSHAQIYEHVWGAEYADAPPNLIHNHMKNIRRKIQWNDSLPKYIWTKRGRGYAFSPQYVRDRPA